MTQAMRLRLLRKGKSDDIRNRQGACLGAEAVGIGELGANLADASAKRAGFRPG